MKNLIIAGIFLCTPFFASAAVYGPLYGPQLPHEDGYTMPAEGYIRVTDGCGVHFEGECLNVRSKPSTSSGVLSQARNDQVFPVSEVVWNEGRWWYHIYRESNIVYPERTGGIGYLAVEYADWIGVFDENLEHDPNKVIKIDVSEQKLRAYEGEELVYEMFVSTGINAHPTPIGTFEILRKMPSRYMQGPIPGLGIHDSWDLPGVPFTMYFTHQGAALHAAFWHNSYGKQYSHGCVNQRYEDALWLYLWAPVGTKVVVSY